MELLAASYDEKLFSQRRWLFVALDDKGCECLNFSMCVKSSSGWELGSNSYPPSNEIRRCLACLLMPLFAHFYLNPSLLYIVFSDSGVALLYADL